MSSTNHQVRLAARPSGLPRSSDWEITEEPTPTPGEGQLVAAVSHISLDPAMRGWMNAGASYIEPVEIGDVMRAAGVGRVTASEHPGFAPGDHVYGTFGVQEFALSDGKGVMKIDPSLAPPPTYLGTLGLSGLTAYFGLLDVGKLGEGDTVAVSGAAGAVGSIAGQIAKLKGARVIGIAGGEAKCRWLIDELGFDAAVDYKGGDLRRALRAACPDGVDVYFDNVGGDIFEACLFNMANHGRIACCGAVSQYDGAAPPHGPRGVPGLFVVRRLVVRGFIVSDFASQYDKALANLKAWVEDGALQVREDIIDGFENLPTALVGLLAGENIGKRMVRVG